MSTKVDYSPGVGCLVVFSTAQTVSVTYFYSIFVDSVVFILCSYRILGWPCRITGSQLVNMIFQDGLIYFIIVFVVLLLPHVLWMLTVLHRLLINVPAAVIAALDLNPVMDTISSTLVSVASVV